MIEVEALKLALKKEEDAIKAYQKMIVEYPSIKDLLYTLVTEEQKHKKLIIEKIQELTHY